MAEKKVEEGVIWVNAHWKDADGNVTEAPTEEHRIKVQTFETEVARVTHQAGGTINIGNFSNFRIEIGVSLPCYVEEVTDAQQAAAMFVNNELDARMREIRETMEAEMNGGGRRTPRSRR